MTRPAGGSPDAARPTLLPAATRLLPGLVAAIGVAIAARVATTLLPAVISEVTIAILIGLVLGRLPAARSPAVAPGLKVAAERLLRLGIVLLGARLGVDQIAGIGLPAAAVVAVTMAAALIVVLGLSRAASIDGRLAVLLAVGAAVCGNSAVVATSPVIGARPRDTAYAVATVTLFGTIAVFAYPLIGHAAGLGDAAFGLWAGIAINDTSQVVAASSAFSPGAFEVATVVKLIRNALMAPLLLGIAWAWQRRTGQAGDTRAGLRRAVPLFVLGFLAMSALRSVGAIDAPLAATLESVARALILVALSAVGLNVRAEELRAVGPRPFLIGLGSAIAIGVATIVAITAFGLADGLVIGR
ncbi:MAG TPA: putative sulfate exporter family transporter [Patescibacteria group bacterium]|nr:putative sulfate exporter family transporter [Patescibacteria group bacterium]